MITETQFKEIYSRYQSSGLPIRSFCMNEGINESKFYYWKKRLRLSPSGGFSFIPVRLESGKPDLVSTGNPPANPVFSFPSTCNSNCDCSFEITYPNGTRLKFSGSFDYDSVKSLVLLNR